MSFPKPKQDTLCWTCEYASAKDEKCPWACRFEPVPGWKAIPTKVKADLYGRQRYTDSFIVLECPLYELMSELKRREEERKKAKEELENKPKEKRKTKAELIAEIKELREKGVTYEEIAKALQMTSRSVYRLNEKNKGEELWEQDSIL